jgi:hypothetical protein
MRRKWWSCGLLAVLGVLFLVALWPCAHTVRDGEGWGRSAFSLKCIGIALDAYHEVNGQLPPAVVRGTDGRPLYSWRVLLLPYLEHVQLYERFNLDEPWDSPHNRALVQEMPPYYRPHLSGDDPPGTTRYQVLVGPGTAFERPGLTWADFADGRGNTLLVVEAATPVVWSAPDDLAYDPAGPLPGLGGVWTKPVRFLCREFGRRPGFVACLGDGRVRFVRQSNDERVVRAAITRNGGEAEGAAQLE